MTADRMRVPDLSDPAVAVAPPATTVRGGQDESRTLQRAGWAAAAAVVLLVAGLT